MEIIRPLLICVYVSGIDKEKKREKTGYNNINVIKNTAPAEQYILKTC